MFRALALRRLARFSEAKAVLNEMIAASDRKIENADLRTYYCVGSPSPMPFEQDIRKMNLTDGHVLKAYALLGLGRFNEADEYIKKAELLDTYDFRIMAKPSCLTPMISESWLIIRSKMISDKMRIETLTCGDLTAVINLSRGANCIALTHSTYGADILRQPNYESLDNPYLYGMPILFPVNRISGGSFSFDGRTYRFPVNETKTGCALHGSLHESAFAVTKQSENHITCLYSQLQTEDFPHDFEVELAY